jgi:monomeric sarcosine oxidase
MQAWKANMKHYDVVVIGLGAAGSAALHALAKVGVHAAGFDRFAPPHALGASHGETRLLRTAYSEGAFYVPLVKRAVRLWKALERETGTTLFEQSGVVYAGANDNPFIASAREAARLGQMALGQARGLDAWFALGPDWARLVDKGGGYVHPERAIAAFLKAARKHGAKIVMDCRCGEIERTRNGIVVHTARGAVSADRVIATTGAWIDELVPALKGTTFVERRVLHWFADPQRLYTKRRGFRAFAIAPADDQLVYGFPANTKGEVKVAEHRSVQVIASPDQLDRHIRRDDIAAIAPLARALLPGLGRRVRSEVCMYPMAPDERFILAPLPNDPRIVVGAGLSGHGFKFAPAIGEVLANYALGRTQRLDVAPFAFNARRAA